MQRHIRIGARSRPERRHGSLLDVGPWLSAFLALFTALGFAPDARADSEDGFRLLATIGERLVSVDKETGVATEIGPTTGYAITELAYDEDAHILYGIVNAFTDPQLVRIDPSSAQVTELGAIDLPGMDLDMIEAFAFDPQSGKLFAAGSEFGPSSGNFTSEKLLTIDPATITTTHVQDITGTLQDEADGFDLIHGVIYAVDGDASTSFMYRIDPGSAQGSLVGMLREVETNGFSYDASSGTLYAFEQQSRLLVSLSQADAQPEVIGPTHSAGDFNGDLMSALVVTTPAPPALPFSFDLVGTIGDRLVAVDELSGAATEIGPTTGYTITELAYDQNVAALLGIANALVDPLLVSIDPSTAQVTEIGPIDLVDPAGTVDLDMVEALNFDPRGGVLYAAASELGPPADNYSEMLVIVDPTTGDATYQQDFSGTLHDEADGFDFINGVMYALDGNDQISYMYRIDPATASGSLVGPLQEFDTGGFSYFSSTGTLYAFERQNRRLVSLSQADAQATVIGPTHAASDFDGELMSALAAIPAAPPFLLSISPPRVRAGDQLRISTCGGAPGGLVLLYLVGIDGAPWHLRMAQGSFDGYGRWDFSVTVPAGLPALEVDFLSYGIMSNSKAGATNRATLILQ